MHPFAVCPGMGSTVQEPISLLSSTIKYRYYLPYGIDRDEHPGNQPGQDQYANDDRIDITMNTPEDVHVLHLSLSADCIGGSWATTSCVAG
jgi:hypothetical protein